MKKIFRFIITQLLIAQAKQYLKKHRTQVIAITGSIGKTSVKEATYHLLKNHFKVYKSPQGFNTEIGISLAVLQEEKSGFSSPVEWFKILKRTFLKEKTAYQKIILEMGADRPGDIKKLISIAKPKIGIITNVNPVHLNKNQFKDLAAIQKEKGSLIKNMAKDGLAILNYDDPLVKSMETHATKVSYGTEDGLEVQGGGVKVHNKNITFQVKYKGETVDFKIPVLGSFQIYTLLPAITVGVKLGMSLQECAEALKGYQLPPGRMNTIDGINDSIIIDSSYNASPTANEKALELLNELPAKRKIAAMGTMNELGEFTKEAHLKLGAQTAEVSNILITVGPEASIIKQGAIEAGMPEKNIYTFFDSEAAGLFLQKELRPDDLILAKGSQNRVRMERMVKMIMRHPEKASVLLCRQDDAWSTI